LTNIIKKNPLALILFVIVLELFIPSASFSQPAPINKNFSNVSFTTNKTSLCNCVVFRMDDVQDNWIRSAQLDLMNVFLSKKLDLTLGLIMNDIGNDSYIVDKVNEGRHKGLFKLAVHGWNHIDYSRLSEQDQKNTILKALEKMNGLFGVRSNIFIPPYDLFNRSTIKAMNGTGIRILSSALWEEDDFDGGKDVFAAGMKIQNNTAKAIYHLPETISFDDYTGNDDEHTKNSNQDILSNVTNNISTNGYAVIVIHPQDFVKIDQRGEVTNVADENRKKDLLNLIDLLLSNNIHITSFDSVIKWSPAILSSGSIYQIMPHLLSIKELKANECVPGFNVTGYFTPVESDYNNNNNNTKKMTITIEDVGEKTFNAQFITDVKTQGWGKTLEGWYLGFYDNAWHKSLSPLGANDKPLAVNSVATDPRLIPSGSKLIVTTLPRPYNNTVFSADDISTSTNGKQINIYVGEGKLAEDKISKIRGNDNNVCLVSQS
jgi:peptidoglycan/xylan/chitin deacetylase (PgdA/CDA1 family)/3D (Asp-Asp-Asp) domain-containing protein